MQRHSRCLATTGRSIYVEIERRRDDRLKADERLAEAAGCEGLGFVSENENVEDNGYVKRALCFSDLQKKRNKYQKEGIVFAEKRSQGSSNLRPKTKYKRTLPPI